MRQDKRKWVDHLAMEAEEAARNGRMKEVYDITKNPSNETTNAVNDKCGNVLTVGLDRRDCCKENFEEILNRPDDPIADPITKAEIRTALRKIKNRKADMNTTEKLLGSRD